MGKPLTDHEWKVNRLRRAVARDIQCEEMTYETILDIFDRWDVFSNWEDDEFDRRPVDVDALREACEQELGLR